MITDEQIESILFGYTQRQNEFNLSVIGIIAERINKLAAFDNLIDISSMVTYQSEDSARIKKSYADYKRKQLEHLHDDFLIIATMLYVDAKNYYDVYVALEKNLELMELIAQEILKAQTQLDDLLKNPVLVLTDLQNPALLKTYSLPQAYTRVINEAKSYAKLSRELKYTALKRTITQLFNSGVRYATTDNVIRADDTTSANRAIRYNVLDSIKALINNFEDVVGRQFGANGVELSAHIFPAPDHAPAQGHQFTEAEVEKMQSGEDFTDVDGNSYVGFVRQIGQWNCRHYFMKIKLGAKPQYSQKQLDKILEDNERGYTTPDGKHYTLYECTQIQRRMERNIRGAKEQYLMHKALNDGTDLQNIRNRVGKLTRQYKQFSNACDLPIKFERLRVKDYK